MFTGTVQVWHKTPRARTHEEEEEEEQEEGGGEEEEEEEKKEQKEERWEPASQQTACWGNPPPSLAAQRDGPAGGWRPVALAVQAVASWLPLAPPGPRGNGSGP